jgi:hypothetical protein
MGATGIEGQLMMSMLSSRVSQDPEKAREMANVLVRRTDIQSTALLRSLVSSWAQRDPEAALDWALQNSAQLDASALGAAAQSLAQQDPLKAIEYVDRIPERHRTAWITQTASAYGRFDPAAALTWVSRFQGQPVHDMALREIISGVAQADPVMAAQVLSQASPDVQSGSAMQVASQWARQDPRAAAEWANGLNDAQAQRSAMTSAVGSWAGNDAAAAKRWTLELRPGEARDQALQILVSRAAAGAVFDRELIAGISSPALRQQALQSSITNMARVDPDRARELLASEITDDAQRVQIERNMQTQIEQQNALQIQSSGSIILLR